MTTPPKPREFELEGNGSAPYEYVGPFMFTLRSIAFYTGPLLKLEEKVRVIEYSAYKSVLRERDLALAHDTQPYPTAWAYDQACKALEAERERNRKLSDELKKLKVSGSDGCSDCETGRVTLYTKGTQCLDCQLENGGEGE